MERQASNWSIMGGSPASISNLEVGGPFLEREPRDTSMEGWVVMI